MRGENHAIWAIDYKGKIYNLYLATRGQMPKGHWTYFEPADIYYRDKLRWLKSKASHSTRPRNPRKH